MAPQRSRILVAALAALVTNLAACSNAASTDNASSQAAESAAVSSASLANFEEVAPGLYRGGHPDDAGLAYLASVGVKRIVNLEVGDFIEAFPWDIDAELSNAADRHLEEDRFPMSAFEPAASSEFDDHINQIMAILRTATPDDGIYVHCKHGQDRTGLVIGLERVLIEGWTPQAAHDEMVKIGFHTDFLGLEDYFEDKTGWQPPSP